MFGNKVYMPVMEVWLPRFNNMPCASDELNKALLHRFLVFKKIQAFSGLV